MTIKEAITHYRSGTATEEERLLVEEELEKQQLLSDLLDVQWESGSTEAAPAEEMKQVRKRLRRRNIALVATSLALVAAILIGILSGISQKFPDMVLDANDTLASQYPTPETSTFSQSATDLELLLSAYSKLFHAGLTSQHVISSNNGMGNYMLSFQRYDSAKKEVTHMTASMNQGILTLPVEFWYTGGIDAAYFDGIDYYENRIPEEDKVHIRAQLDALPEYITMKAVISFPEDLTMQQILDFSENWGGELIWAAIRNSSQPMQYHPLCGIDLYRTGQLSYDGINENYPSFVPNVFAPSAEDLEAHFKSLLRFLSDRKKEGIELSAFPEYEDPDNSYQQILDFVEENGIYSYGCVVTATPDQLLELLDKGLISQAWLLDAWLGI